MYGYSMLSKDNEEIQIALDKEVTYLFMYYAKSPIRSGYVRNFLSENIPLLLRYVFFRLFCLIVSALRRIRTQENEWCNVRCAYR